jgi:hypothetical protein
MGFAFNPFTGNFDLKGSGGGGGSAFFAGEVATYADLPLDGTAALNSRWLVRSNSGTWPFSSYKQAGIYIRIGTVGSDRDDDYQLTDTSFHDVMSDDAFLIFDNTDPTKAAKFDVGTNVAAGQTRTLSIPNSSGTIALLSNFLGAFKDAVVLAPSADMSVTSSTTLAAISGMSFTAAATTTYAALCYWQVDAGAGGFRMVLNVPSNFQGVATQAGYGINITGAGVTGSVSTIGADELNIQSVSRAAAQTGPVFSIFAFRTTATSGTAEFRFSQNNSNATASVLKAESRVLIIPLTT